MRKVVLTKAPADVAAFFDLGNMPKLAPRYNVAPTQQVLTVRQTAHGRAAAECRWGLTPPWSGNPKAAGHFFNARSETALEKPAFRVPFKKRRCLVPADGFYEWLPQGKRKVPHLFSLLDGALLAIAGLWAVWEKDGQRVESVCLITTEANEVVQAAHDRIPVILPPDARKAWLDPASDPGVLQSLLRPYPAAAMTCRQVNPALNNARNEGPECRFRRRCSEVLVSAP